MENANLIFSRRSKFYSANIATWKRTLAAYSGGRKYDGRGLGAEALGK